MRVNPAGRFRGSTLINPYADLLDSRPKSRDVLVDAIEQGGGGIVWAGVSSIEKESVAQERGGRASVKHRQRKARDGD